MDRKYIVVGDEPACGGAVLPFTCSPSDSIDGHQKALIGGRVFCAACNSITKAGGPYRPNVCDIEYALEGDMVECGCPQPSPLVSSKHNRAWCDDRSGIEGQFEQAKMAKDWYRPDSRALVSSKRAVDEFATHSAPKDFSASICADMADDDFFKHMMNLRDRAVKITMRRLQELDDWASKDQGRVHDWFGRSDEKIRSYLKDGLSRMVAVLKALTSDNFLKYTADFGAAQGCISVTPPNQLAAVCRTDVTTRKIAFTLLFCTTKDISPLKDSQVSTLIHEVTHFVDVLDTYDRWYGLTESKWKARLDPVGPISNADSYAGYICEGMKFPD